MIERVDGPIIRFSLGHPELWRDGLIHDLEGEERLYVKLYLKRPDGSDLKGLKLAAHVINLANEIDSSLFCGREGLVKIRGLRRES